MAQEPIAIVGIGCRFPGEANTSGKFWQLLQSGFNAITDIPSDRWNQQTFYHLDPVEPGKTYVQRGGFINDFDKFDAKFFGINRQEAARLDPQHRHLLEVAWEAFEDAGIPLEKVAGTKTGVFVGMSFHDYPDLQLSPTEVEDLNAYSIMGAGNSGAANRIAYWFDLHGPSMCIDTACSSSLVATHLACQSIWQGESEMALAAGVNIIIKPEVTVAMSKAFLLSADGYCKSFDAQADGYARGEGVGVVVLKPLSQALKDNDCVYAIIRATVVNQDGHKSSLAAPSGLAQEMALQAAYRRAGVTPQQIQYIEAQGTGTQVGDPIEANAIGAVVGVERETGKDCFIGSVKTNIGHLEGAAGIASLIKTALALHHGQIPPNLHFKTPNPKIPFESLHLRVPTHLEKWRTGRRLAGINSFGVGGTNAHVVLENAKPATKKPQRLDDRVHLLPLSAKTLPALRSLVEAYLEYLANGANEAITLSDICYTASMRRSHHSEQRVFFVALTKLELAQQIEQFLKGNRVILPEGSKGDYLGVTQDGAFKKLAQEGQEPARTQFLKSLGQLYLLDEPIDWQVLYPDSGSLVHLPLYPWQRQRYWHESDLSRETRIGQAEYGSQQILEKLTQVLKTEVSHLSSDGFINWEALLEIPAAERQKRLNNYFQEQLQIILERSSIKLAGAGAASNFSFDLEEVTLAQAKYPFLEQLKIAPIYERRQVLVEHIRAQVAEVIGAETSEALDVDRGFFDMGMTSLQAINLQNNLKQSLGCSLPATTAFKYPTIKSLVEYLIEVALPLEFPSPRAQSKHNVHLLSPSPDELYDEINDPDVLLALLLQTLNGEV